MSYQLTDWDLEQITDTLDMYEAGSVMEYSGRAMYGAQCLGIVTEDVPSAFMILGSALADLGNDGNALTRKLLREVRTDSMGRDETVVYFPSITMPAGYVEEDEDND
jgi:hypothetical protein